MVYKPWISQLIYHITAGVPQGSILGPLLFLVYINDIVREIESNIRLFADDTSLSLIVDTPNEAANIINRDLTKIDNWALTWLVTFNPQKTQSMIISRKASKPAHPQIYMLNQPIEEVSSHKHLGLNLSNDLTWNKHINYIKVSFWYSWYWVSQFEQW